jgi:hypothetical protein
LFFGPPQALVGHLAKCVAAKESGCFQLTSESDYFASLDAILYQPDNTLVGIQVTSDPEEFGRHIKTKGLNNLRRLLNSKDVSFLAPLRLTTEQPWLLLFVVPTPMDTTFTKLDIEGVRVAEWDQKIVEFVLDLAEVLREASFQEGDWWRSSRGCVTST